MQEKINEKLWKKIKPLKNIEEEDKEIYIFGIYQGLFFLLNVATTLFIGFILNKFLESVLFLIFFIPLRIYAGGYHAKTQFRCYIMSSITTIIILYLISFLYNNIGVTSIIGYIISAVVIWSAVPVENANKLLYIEEKIKYKNIVRKILYIYTGILILSYSIKWHMIFANIEALVYFIALILLAGIYKNQKKSNCVFAKKLD